MINFKQQELTEEYFRAIQNRFPEAELLKVTESPEDPNDLWVNIIFPEDEDRETELIEFAGNMTIDMLVRYGYHISAMPRNPDSSMVKMFRHRSMNR